MTYGSDIGSKFNEDGSVRRYPGNTVVADITPGCSAYDVMQHLRQMVIDAGMADYLILLPTDSYHMTLLGGLNDAKRGDWWPHEKLPNHVSMDIADDYTTNVMHKVGLPGPQRMRFDYVRMSKSAMVVILQTTDEAQEKLLRKFRDDAAQELGAYRPNHDKYRFHISLAYVRVIPEGEAEVRCQNMLEQMNAYLAQQPAFETGAPYVAYFDDMLHYSHTRIPRD